MVAPFLLRRSPYAAKASLRPPRAAPVALLARMMCSPRARSSLVRRSAAAPSVMGAAVEPGVAIGDSDIGASDMGALVMAGAVVGAAVVGAVEAPLPLQALNTAAVKTTPASKREGRCTGWSPWEGGGGRHNCVSVSP